MNNFLTHRFLKSLKTQAGITSPEPENDRAVVTGFKGMLKIYFGWIETTLIALFIGGIRQYFLKKKMLE